MASCDKNLFGIVLAAGRGERMGNRPKAILPIGDETFLSKVAGNMQRGGIAEIVVVLGFHAEKIAPFVPEGIAILVNPAPEKDMLSSILTGLKWADEKHTGALIAMVDYPLVRAETFELLTKEHRIHPGCIISPSFKMSSGHPVIFPKILFRELADCPLETGARHVVRANPKKRKFVVVDDPGIHIDINTPEAYEKFIGPFPQEVEWLSVKA